MAATVSASCDTRMYESFKVLDKGLSEPRFANIWKAMMAGVEVTNWEADPGKENHFTIRLASQYKITEPGKKLVAHFPRVMRVWLNVQACRIEFPGTGYLKPTGPWGKESFFRRGANLWIGWDEKTQEYVRCDGVAGIEEKERAKPDVAIKRWRESKVKTKEKNS